MVSATRLLSSISISTGTPTACARSRIRARFVTKTSRSTVWPSWDSLMEIVASNWRRAIASAAATYSSTAAAAPAVSVTPSPSRSRIPPIPSRFRCAAASSPSSSRSPATKRCAALLVIGFLVIACWRRELPATHSNGRLIMTPPVCTRTHCAPGPAGHETVLNLLRSASHQIDDAHRSGSWPPPSSWPEPEMRRSFANSVIDLVRAPPLSRRRQPVVDVGARSPARRLADCHQSRCGAGTFGQRHLEARTCWTLSASVRLHMKKMPAPGRALPFPGSTRAPAADTVHHR
jgi:hypothetical protein